MEAHSIFTAVPYQECTQNECCWYALGAPIYCSKKPIPLIYLKWRSNIHIIYYLSEGCAKSSKKTVLTFFYEAKTGANAQVRFAIAAAGGRTDYKGMLFYACKLQWHLNRRCLSAVGGATRTTSILQCSLISDSLIWNRFVSFDITACDWRSPASYVLRKVEFDNRSTSIIICLSIHCRTLKLRVHLNRCPAAISNCMDLRNKYSFVEKVDLTKIIW